MSKIQARLEDNILKITCDRTRVTAEDREEVNVSMFQLGRRYRSRVEMKKLSQRNKIYLLEPVYLELEDPASREELDAKIRESEALGNNDEPVLAVWSIEQKLYYSYMFKSQFYKGVINFFYKTLYLGLGRKNLSIYLIGYFKNEHKIPIQSQKFYIDESNWQESHIAMETKEISKKKLLLQGKIHYFKIPLVHLLSDDTQINNTLNIRLEVEGVALDYRIGKKYRNKNANVRCYYAPYKSRYMKDFAIHIRRTTRGNFTIVKRAKEAIENTLWFRFMESRPVSFLLYHLGKWKMAHSRKNVNLFYEKFAMKAEEGAYDLFLKAQESPNSNNYYIIDKHSEDYPVISSQKNVVKKYSLKYYWLLYRVNYYISTEAPVHLNILRSNNKYFRKSTCERPFIFLQHGVTYLKCQGDSSTFGVGKEGEAYYMIAGSKKEKDAIADMLKIPEERIWNTGLPIFSKIDYMHLNQDSEDKVVIMLTWKTYEEHLLDFEQSEYYKNVTRIYEILSRYIAPSSLIVVPHPKVLELLENTEKKDSVWRGPISEVLKVAKLLVTDYSSVCYNVFYQGGGVIFYQPDLEMYEAESGRLIPREDEYIGERVFTLEDFERVVQNVIVDGRVVLDNARTKHHEEMYQTINEYSDGKNIERIYQKLADKKII